MSRIITTLTDYFCRFCILQLYTESGELMDQNEFAKRLVELRLNKGVSARDMSLSIGQSPGYINNIENGINYPSMTVFFYICDYFGITPMEFFDIDMNNPVKTNELCEMAKKLNKEQLDSIISLIRNLIK